MKHVLFIQGAGSQGANEEDKALVDSLRAHLGSDYRVHYPLMPDEVAPDFHVWQRTILKEIEDLQATVVLVGHSIGASVLVKIFTQDNTAVSKVRGLFLVAGPFWHDDAFWHWEEAQLPTDAGDRYPQGLPLYLYHGESDPFVPVSHLEMYTKALPQAVSRLLPGRDHQLNGDLSEVAEDILRLS